MSKEAMNLALEALLAATPVKAKDPQMQAVAIAALQEALAEPQQEPDGCRHIGEQDCLLDVDEKAWRSLVKNRGGCRCHISPPCGACSNPISEEELNEVGYTYTTPPAAQTAQPAPVQDVDWKDMYEKEKQRSEMWVVKYEKDIGPLEYAVPVAAPVQEPVAWRVKWPAIGGGHKWIMADKPLMEREGFVNEALYTTPPAAPVQEPEYVQIRHIDEVGDASPWGQPLDPKERHTKWAKGFEMRLLYTAPPAAQRSWVGLTDEQVTRLCKTGAVYAPDGVVTRTPLQYREELEGVARTAVRKAEAKLKELNA